MAFLQSAFRNGLSATAKALARPTTMKGLSVGHRLTSRSLATASSVETNPFAPLDTFVRRHIGPQEDETKEMLKSLGYDSLDAFTNANVPKNIQLNRALALGRERGEHELLQELKAIASKNKVLRSFIGMGYYGTIVPGVIQRNILENPGWYTSYTPYQAEISQGRLEMLLNYQTMVMDLTKMDVANASLLDEGTAAAEAMNMAWNNTKKKRNTFYVSSGVHPQSIGVIKTRADSLGINVVVGDHNQMDFSKGDVCGVIVQYPATDGKVEDLSAFADKVHKSGAIVIAATDLLALTQLKPPGEWGADIALGNSQRFGVPMGYGGPHAAFFAVKDAFKRIIPGRLIGVSKDRAGDAAIRMSLQSREQHIRRETATSNICTAQALLANMAAAYAIYHGPKGLRDIGNRTHRIASVFATGVSKLGFTVPKDAFFDTVKVGLNGKVTAAELMHHLVKKGINVRKLDENTVTVSFDETTTERDVTLLFEGFAEAAKSKVTFNPASLAKESGSRIDGFARKSEYLTHPIFNTHHSETEMLRYLKKLENKDLSLTHSMIALGSCTMKLNATSEMYPVTWPEFGSIHPFVPIDQAQGYHEMFSSLSSALSEITGFAAVSLQPNSGAQGEYAGLRVIKAYLNDTNQKHRNVCLIPTSAHGTNPASAAMAGLRIVPIKSDDDGNVDIKDLKEKAQQHSKELACLMITYPSTYGVFEEGIKEICQTIHNNGGLVYMDGANMNSQVGLCRPGDIGADVCHLNLHKTFCIPHGGGGPGMGPIGVTKQLQPYLPNHPVVDMGQFGGSKGTGPVSAAPFGSAAILPISHVYIQLMGADGLKKATQMAVLNANYMAKKLKELYPIRYHKKGLVAHELILDFAPFKATADVGVEDVAKRLADYGFHAPTVSWPIHDTMMPEPTESESKEEMDRFVEALRLIRQEIKDIETGKADKKNNPLRNAPHTLKSVTSDNWTRPYTREQAAFPAPWTRKQKFWPSVERIDGAFGDRNLICSCPPMEDLIANQK
eukprot:TRINITY_DN1319_c0_g3_i1.p1 TRINITY_DN1319_c0_g3~~TRINITY_DN1319_c0_g3_i1.p1  ORF type:complete len:1010 (-),score=304.66 TRINITY_DN1319_c0_g3_i1:65-3094(-)